MDQISDDTPGLFGWVPAPARGQGRPPFAWTREKSNKVMVLFAAGYGHADVAAVLGCDAKTLRKVFSRECAAKATADLVLRTGMMGKLIELAEQGNVAAVKQLETMIEAEKARAQHARRAGKEPEKPVAEKPVKLGKKDQARQDAAEAEGIFAPRPAPGQATGLH